MTMTSAVRIVGVLAAFAFAGQINMAAMAEQPGGGIQSNKAKASESPRLTKGLSCSGDAPKIKKVSPDEGKTGDKVTITGERFGGPGCISMVSFGPGSPAKFTQADDKTITATVPEGKKGMELLTVTGFTGEDTKPFLRK
jgi:hypothetical protein